MLDFVDSGDSGALKAASGSALEATGGTPPIPGSSEDHILHTRSKVFL